MHDFQGYFIQNQSDCPELSRSWNFQEKIQDFPGGVETLGLESQGPRRQKTWNQKDWRKGFVQF